MKRQKAVLLAERHQTRGRAGQDAKIGAAENFGTPRSRILPLRNPSNCRHELRRAKNVEAAKDFLKYFIQPKVNNEWLKTGLGRNIPCMPSVVKNDPWWFADPHRAAYAQQGLLGPTLPQFWAFNPAYAQVRNEHVWSVGWTDIMQGGMAPQAAAEKAFKRVEEIFSKYPIAPS
jgi:ABC-type glycerol-3-phosphate transport system substrate-binding protein